MTRKRVREISKAKCTEVECKRGQDIWYATEREFGAGIGIWKKRNQSVQKAQT